MEGRKGGERGERKKKALSHLAPPQKILDPQLDKRKGQTHKSRFSSFSRKPKLNEQYQQGASVCDILPAAKPGSGSVYSHVCRCVCLSVMLQLLKTLTYKVHFWYALQHGRCIFSSYGKVTGAKKLSVSGLSSIERQTCYRYHQIVQTYPVHKQIKKKDKYIEIHDT